MDSQTVIHLHLDDHTKVRKFPTPCGSSCSKKTVFTPSSTQFLRISLSSEEEGLLMKTGFIIKSWKMFL